MTRLASIPYPGLIKLLFVLGGVIYVRGLFIDVMEVDSAQYAAIAKEMLNTRSFLEVYFQGADYLDKPPLIFWTAAGLFSIFGVHTWVFKLPTFLFTIIGLFSTFKIGERLYSKEVGVVSALILFATQATFLMNNDVRTDGLLTGIIPFAIWQILEFIQSQKRSSLIWGFIGIGLGMLAKGPLGLMIPLLALGTYFIANRQWKDLFRKEWLLGILITAVVLSPMVWGLYTQFDMHPEKEVRFFSESGEEWKTGVSGVRFYFWTQSFGRLTGENVWKDDSGPTFFIDNYLWSFLPFSFLGIWALFHSLKEAGQQWLTGRGSPDWLLIGGFLFPFIAMSFSQYKLPHYIWPTYPFLSILVAKLVFYLMDRPGKWRIHLADILQGLVLLLSIAFGILIQFRFFPFPSWGMIIGWVALVLWSVYLFTRRKRFARWVLASVTASLSVNLVMNGHFYPHLLQYQSSSQVAHYLEAEEFSTPIFVNSTDGGFALDFYMDKEYQVITMDGIRNRENLPNEFLLVVNSNADPNLNDYSREVIRSFPKFHISILSLDFLIPESRQETLGTIEIIRYSKIGIDP